MSAWIKQPVVWVAVGVVALGGVVIGIIVMLSPHSPVPVAIARQVKFPIMYPESSGGFDTVGNTMSYDSNAQGLLFHVRAKSGGIDLTVTEQATPGQFNDISQYYPALIVKLNGYSEFDSVNGRVDLTHPSELNGAQSAVYNGKGVLMFARPSRDMSEGEWQQFFNSMVIAK